MLLPHCQALNGAGLPSSVDTMWGPARLSSKSYGWRNRSDVEAAFVAIDKWLEAPSKIRPSMKVLQLGGLVYASHVDTLCLTAYRKCGGGKETMSDDAVARLCQGDGSKAVKTPMNGESF